MANSRYTAPKKYMKKEKLEKALKAAFPNEKDFQVRVRFSRRRNKEAANKPPQLRGDQWSYVASRELTAVSFVLK
jgi:hypothetical protein